jgi:thiol-disulfide isomerase/thioredoxin
VLLDFGANWCPDCIVLARLFEDGAVKPYLTANFHLVRVNVGRSDQNQNLCAEYGNPTGKGIPAVVVLDPKGRVLASTNGGELANARTATAREILEHLKRWRTANGSP